MAAKDENFDFGTRVDFLETGIVSMDLAKDRVTVERGKSEQKEPEDSDDKKAVDGFEFELELDGVEKDNTEDNIEDSTKDQDESEILDSLDPSDELDRKIERIHKKSQQYRDKLATMEADFSKLYTRYERNKDLLADLEACVSKIQLEVMEFQEDVGRQDPLDISYTDFHSSLFDFNFGESF